MCIVYYALRRIAAIFFIVFERSMTRATIIIDLLAHSMNGTKGMTQKCRETISKKNRVSLCERYISRRVYIGIHYTCESVSISKQIVG